VYVKVTRYPWIRLDDAPETEFDGGVVSVEGDLALVDGELGAVGGGDGEAPAGEPELEGSVGVLGDPARAAGDAEGRDEDACGDGLARVLVEDAEREEGRGEGSGGGAWGPCGGVAGSGERAEDDHEGEESAHRARLGCPRRWRQFRAWRGSDFAGVVP